MTNRIAVALLIVMGAAWTADSQIPEPTNDLIPGAHRLTHLSALVGDWAHLDGTREAEKRPFVRYQLVANGRALVERLSVGQRDEVMSVYHLDHRTLQVTQYSPYGAHPTLAAKATADRGKVVFRRVSGASLDPAVSEHIQKVEIRLTSDDEIELHWVRYKGGEAVGTFDFPLRRLKKS